MAARSPNGKPHPVWWHRVTKTYVSIHRYCAGTAKFSIEGYQDAPTVAPRADRSTLLPIIAGNATLGSPRTARTEENFLINPTRSLESGSRAPRTCGSSASCKVIEHQSEWGLRAKVCTPSFDVHANPQPKHLDDLPSDNPFQATCHFLVEGLQTGRSPR